MPDLASLIRTLTTDGSIARVAQNPAAQFGVPERSYLGAAILPERTVPENAFTEYGIKYRTVVANAGTRYSPVQKKGGALSGSFKVELAEADIGSEFTSRDYDALLRYLQNNATMEATTSLTRWLDTTVNAALIETLERWRWQAIVDAVVQLRGDNDYSEDIAYSNPAGHRFNAGVWSTDSVDPFDDIFAGAQILADKGFNVGRIITSRRVIGIMGGNDKVKTRTSRVVLNTSGQITASIGRVTRDDINGVLSADGLPPIELYDLRYRTSTGTGRFLADTVMVLIGTTGRDEELDLGDSIEVLPDTLGYAAIGRAAGQSAPGRVIRMEAKEDKPPRVLGEGWATQLPVITEPEAVVVIKAIA